MLFLPTASDAVSGEAEHNRDLAPRRGAVETSSLTHNQPVWEAFQAYERTANRLKKRYERLGWISVLSIGASAVYAAYRAFIPGAGWYGWLDILAAVIGALGILMDIWIRSSRLKLRWLINRFAAERVRSAKFQLYALAAVATSPAKLEAAVARQTALAMERIAEECGFPVAALNAFSPPSALDLPALCATEARSERRSSLFTAAVADYREWRIRYQHRFAEQMSRDIADQQGGYGSTSDALFTLGALVLLASVALRASPSAVIAVELLEATGLALFIITAMTGVLSGGAAHLASNSRYQQYSRDLSRLLDENPKTPDDFVRLVERTELLALRELDDFWRDIWISSYRS